MTTLAPIFNRRYFHYCLNLIIFLFLAFFSPPIVHALPAFPGAEGFGTDTLGGRQGTVYIVNTLNPTGTGSLQACASASGPRTCVFTVGGTIVASSAISISNPYITIAGQTAPGGGITIRKSSGGDIFNITTHDVVIRYITGRPGPGGENHAVQLAVNNSSNLYNIVFDHCSFSWGVDSVWETWYQVRDTTIQWSFANEGLDCSTHSKGCHSKGIMIGGYKKGESSSEKGSYNISVHHNLMAHDGERTPLMQFCGTGQVINNITYNPYWTFAHQEDNCIDHSVNSTVNWIGNYHKKGPDSTSNADLKVIAEGAGVSHVYVEGNLGPSCSNNVCNPASNWVDSGSRSFIVTTPAVAPAVTTTAAQLAYDQVLATGGNSQGIDCNGNWFARRDSHDTRVVNEVKTGTGHIIDDPSEVGGWATIAGGTACTDSDHDGIADTWETAKYGNLTRATSTSLHSSGYTDLEAFMDGIDPQGGGPNPTAPAPPPSNTPASATPTPTTPPANPSPTPKPGDFTLDGFIDSLDLVSFLPKFATNNTSFNLVGSSLIDIFDFNRLLSNLGIASSAPPPTGTTSSFNFISWSDTEDNVSNCADILAALSNQAKTLNPAFTIYNGDAECGTLTNWQNALNGNVSNGMSAKSFVVRGNGNTGDSNWSTFFNFSSVANTVAATNFTDYSSSTPNRTYSFDYGNSRFIGLDFPGCPSQFDSNTGIRNFALNRITDAESRGLSHVFLFMHGPIWYTDSHSDCTVPTNLLAMINAHPIVTATFSGHEHLKAVLNFSPPDTRLNLSHPFRQVVTGGAGGDTYPCNTSRYSTSTDYCNKYEGYANVTVNGNGVTVDFYRQGSGTTPSKVTGITF